MNTKLLSIFAVFFLLSTSVFGQFSQRSANFLADTTQKVTIQKLRYGGNFGLGFFGGLYVDASPMVGYEINNKGLSAGVGTSLLYLGGKSLKNKASYGGRVFVRQDVLNFLFLQAEYEVMNADASRFYGTHTSTSNKRRWGAVPIVSVGYYQGGLRRGSADNNERKPTRYYISLTYNLAYPKDGFVGIYQLSNDSPIGIRVGFY